jgi:small subunit ribosomal protein S17
MDNAQIQENLAEQNEQTAAAEVVAEMPAAEVQTTATEEPKQEAEAAAPKQKGRKRILTGKVVSNKGDKTIIVKVERQVAHPLYKKYYKKSNKFMAHDENNDCNIGDLVKVEEHKPLSKRKRWNLIEIITRAK